MSRIVATRKSTNGEITDVMLDDNTELSVEEAINQAEAGMIEGVVIGYAGRDEFKHKTLRSFPDGNDANNLRNLPSF